MRARLVLVLGFLQLHCSRVPNGDSTADFSEAGQTTQAAAGVSTAGGAAASGASTAATSLAGSGGNNGGGAAGGVAGSAPTAGANVGGGAGSGGNATGVGGAGGAPVGNDPEIPTGFVPALIGVGYGGIRVVSRDNGKTWGDRKSFGVNGGDDDNLLRAVVYGKGMWLATGWKLVTSNDGKLWQDRGKIHDGGFMPCNIVEGLAYAGGWFYAACAEEPAVTYRSTEGLKWTKYGTIGSTQGHLFMTFRAGKFVAYGDNHNSFESTDALTFHALAGISEATYCADTWKSQADCFNAAWFSGAYLRPDWQGKISRSENGSTWTKVYEDNEQNTLYQSRAMAAGYVAP